MWVYVEFEVSGEPRLPLRVWTPNPDDWDHIGYQVAGLCRVNRSTVLVLDVHPAPAP